MDNLVATTPSVHATKPLSLISYIFAVCLIKVRLFKESSMWLNVIYAKFIIKAAGQQSAAAVWCLSPPPQTANVPSANLCDLVYCSRSTIKITLLDEQFSVLLHGACPCCMHDTGGFNLWWISAILVA